MANQLKTKLCWNCEGRVGFKEEHCSFCGVYLSPTSIYGETIQEDSLAGDNINELNEKKPYTANPYQEGTSSQGTQTNKMALSILPSQEVRQLCMTLGALLFGSAFFLFGITLFLFAKDGILTLKWDGDYWYYYLVLSAGLLFFGWRNLSDGEEEDDKN